MSDFPLALLPALGGVAGGVLSEDSEGFFKDKARGALKGISTGGGAALGSLADSSLGGSGVLGGIAGGGLGYLAGNQLLDKPKRQPNLAMQRMLELSKKRLLEAGINASQPKGLLPSVFSIQQPQLNSNWYYQQMVNERLGRQYGMKQGAVGIPDKSNYGDPTSLPINQLVDWYRQRHMADRAGMHQDIRFGTPETGLYSFATRKELPPPKGKISLFQQPLHEHSYGRFQGKIESGYGKGTVTREDEGKILLTKVEPNAIHFTVAHKKVPERFALIKPRDPNSKQWLLVNTTPTDPIPYDKVHYTTIPAEDVEKHLNSMGAGGSVQTKIDGAAGLVKLLKDKVEVASYRAAKNTGHPIIHSEKFQHGRDEPRPPKDLIGSVLRTEMYGTDPAGKAIRPQALGGLLNSTLANSLTKQQEKGVTLKNLAFDISQYGKKPITHDTPYQQRLDMVNDILNRVPLRNIHAPSTEPKEAPTMATNPEAAKALWNQIRSGQHPLTHEGIVIHPYTGKPVKAKLTNEHDVFLREFFPGGGKYQGNAVGGFRYSHEPEGPIAGEVGTGFDDELRRHMFTNPEEYLGQKAKVISQEKYPSGALRMPSFHSMHLDEPLTKTALKKLAELSSQGITTTKALEPQDPGLLPEQPSASILETPRQSKFNPGLHPMIQQALDNKPKGPSPVLKALLAAKGYSDSRQYREKSLILQDIIAKNPNEFFINSIDDNGIAGISHRSGFKIHAPLNILPEILRKRGIEKGFPEMPVAI